MSTLYRTTIIWLKQGETPLARHLFHCLKQIRTLQLPRIPALFSVLYRGYGLVRQLLDAFLRVFWWTPLFRSQVMGPANQLLLYGGLPLLSGGIQIWLGNGCRVSGQTTFSARTSSKVAPTLEIGNNVDVGWQTTIAVGQSVKLGDNVRIAAQCLLAGYPGHPLNRDKRAKGEPETDEQVGDIILEPDVWLATGVKVMAGVTIGQGTVVAAGSVVTCDLPAGVLAGGVPARVIKVLESES